MKTSRFSVSLAGAVACLLAVVGPSLRAAEVKTYQVTGPILELTETAVVVQKGDDKWEIARDKKTRINGALKVGSKVTIYYRMIAAEIESKETREAAPPKPSK